MNNLNNLKVGDNVYIVYSKYARRDNIETTVTKIGKKYIETIYGKFCIETGVEYNKGYMPMSKLWFSKKDYEEWKEIVERKSSLISLIETSLRALSVDNLLEIQKLMESFLKNDNKKIKADCEKQRI